jgi:hypothetical protein
MNQDQTRAIEIAVDVIFKGTEYFKDGIRREDYERLTAAAEVTDSPTGAMTVIRDAIARCGFFASADTAESGLSEWH